MDFAASTHPSTDAITTVAVAATRAGRGTPATSGNPRALARSCLR